MAVSELVGFPLSSLLCKWETGVPGVSPWWDTCVSYLYLQSYVTNLCMFLSLVSKTLMWCRRQELIAFVQPNQCSCSLNLWWKISVSDEPPKWHLCHAAAGISMAAYRYFSLLMFLQPPSLCSSKMQIFLALPFLPLQMLLSKYVLMILQMLSLKVFRWDFSHVSVLAA